ncbi:MAG: hypothetical protein OK442_03715 [Thaumarchaeota archaeon]|nr:hypothetical protein [Nitrososphaerota archaeon]
MEAMTGLDERIGLRIVGLLVIVGFASSAVLWTIDTSLPSGESLFAVYLSIDLIAFVMISYIYRVTKTADGIGRIPLLAGSCVLILLVIAGFAV